MEKIVSIHVYSYRDTDEEQLWVDPYYSEQKLPLKKIVLIKSRTKILKKKVCHMYNYGYTTSSEMQIRVTHLQHLITKRNKNKHLHKM